MKKKRKTVTNLSAFLCAVKMYFDSTHILMQMNSKSYKSTRIYLGQKFEQVFSEKKFLTKKNLILFK